MPRQTRDRPWVVVFILLSLLAHLLFVLAIVLVGHFFPPPKLKDISNQLTSVTLSLQQPPPVARPPSQPPPKHMFMPTAPDAEAQHKQSQIESDNDTMLRSKAPSARLPDSLLPDVVSKREHATSLRDAPNSPSQTPPHPGPTASATQNQQQQKSAQQNPQPSTQTKPAPAEAKQPSPTAAKEPTTNPQKEPAPKVAKEALDPNGLPVLPPIAAPTMAPASQHEEPTPASSMEEQAQDVHGAVGGHGANSPQSMATEFGKYKAKVYRAVGGRWYPKVDKQFQVLPVGVVHIQFTIHDDGTVDTKVLQGNEGSLQILMAISLNSIREAAPFDPFTESLRREIAKEENNDGSSYTDDFTFSIYGGQ